MLIIFFLSCSIFLSIHFESTYNQTYYFHKLSYFSFQLIVSPTISLFLSIISKRLCSVLIILTNNRITLLSVVWLPLLDRVSLINFHTFQYPSTSYRNFYLFLAIFDRNNRNVRTQWSNVAAKQWFQCEFAAVLLEFNNMAAIWGAGREGEVVVRYN